MSFQEFQRGHNRLTPREIGFLVLAGIVTVLMLYVLAVGNYYLANLLPDGGEFYLLRTGGRSFLFNQIEPYSGSVSARVQQQVYGRSAVQGEDLYTLDMPFHLLILFFPLALFPDALMARAFWMALSEIAWAGFIYFSFRLIDRQVPIIFYILIAIAGFVSFYAYQSLVAGSLAMLLGLAYVGILLSLRAGFDELTGALLVLSAFQWEMGGVFILFVALWTFWERRWRVYGGAAMLVFILLAVSFFWYPGWVLPFFRASWASFRFGFGYSIHNIFGHLWPQYGSTLGWILTAILIFTLGYELRAARGNFIQFFWAICLSLAAAPLLGFHLEMEQLVLLTLPVMLIIIISRERWQRFGSGIAIFLLLFFFGLSWLIFIQGVPQGFGLQADETLFLFWPVSVVVGLYWIRWWMIHPPRTWLDKFSQGT